MYLPISADLVSISPASPGSVDIGDPMPANTTLMAIIVAVTTAFDTAATMTLGDNVTPDLYAAAEHVDLQVAGLYEIPVYKSISVLTQARAYLNLASASAGAATIYLVLRNT